MSDSVAAALAELGDDELEVDFDEAELEQLQDRLQDTALTDVDEGSDDGDEDEDEDEG